MVAVAQARQAVHTRLLTPFFGKLGQKGIRRSSRWKAEYNRSIEGREEWSTRFADSQKGSMLTVGQLVNVIS
jgi:hypothetical protein